MSWAWTDTDQSEYERAYRQWKLTMGLAEIPPDETFRKIGAKPVKRPDYFWIGLVLLAGCVAWAALAVFVWGGNLTPQ